MLTSCVTFLGTPNTPQAKELAAVWLDYQLRLMGGKLIRWS